MLKLEEITLYGIVQYSLAYRKFREDRINIYYYMGSASHIYENMNHVK